MGVTQASSLVPVARCFLLNTPSRPTLERSLFCRIGDRRRKRGTIFHAPSAILPPLRFFLPSAGPQLNTDVALGVRRDRVLPCVREILVKSTLSRGFCRRLIHESVISGRGWKIRALRLFRANVFHNALLSIIN